MYEEKTITAAEPIPEKQTKFAKPKRTDNEKLTEYYEQRARLLGQKNAVNKKGDEIKKRLSENNAKIAELENKELFKICKKKKISAQELIGFLKKMPDGVTLEDVANTAFGQTSTNPEQLEAQERSGSKNDNQGVI